MSFAAAEAAIRQRLVAQWVLPGGGPRTPIAWENVPFDPDAAPGGPWVLAEIQFGGATQAGLAPPGSVPYRATGQIQLHCFVPVGSGKAAALDLADAAAAVFRGQSFAGISCRAAYPQRAQATGAWFRVTAAVPFLFDDFA